MDTLKIVNSPTFSVASGAVVGGTSLAIRCSTSGAIIYYIIDGNEPNSSSTVYTETLSEKIRQLMLSHSLCVRDHEHVPMIERTKDGKYKVWEKFKKLNHDWEG